MKSIKLTSAGLLLFVLFSGTYCAYAQEPGDKSDKLDVSGTISVTTEGISIVPALSLGKPASLFNLSVGKRLTFEPDLRFSMEGKPWSFLFWLRYDLLHTDKFNIRIGTHPALNFATKTVVIEGTEREIIEARRFWAGELNTSYSLSRLVSIGTYYLYGHGFETSVPAHTHYLSFNGSISDIPLFRDFSLTLSPQFYYLNIDQDDGFYAATGISFDHSDIPLSISAFYNQSILSDIPGSPKILWNVSLNYSFSF